MWGCSETPVLCCNYKSSLQLPCDFDVMRKSFVGSSVFMRFPFNQNKAERPAEREVAGKASSLHREAISLMKCRLAGVARILPLKHRLLTGGGVLGFSGAEFDKSSGFCFFHRFRVVTCTGALFLSSLAAAHLTVIGHVCGLVGVLPLSASHVLVSYLL